MVFILFIFYFHKFYLRSSESSLNILNETLYNQQVQIFDDVVRSDAY